MALLPEVLSMLAQPLELAVKTEVNGTMTTKVQRNKPLNSKVCDLMSFNIERNNPDDGQGVYSFECIKNDEQHKLVLT